MFILLILLSSFQLLAHSGGTLRSGTYKECHTKHATGEFHCHSKSKFNGKKWSKKPSDNQKVKSLIINKYKRSYFRHWIDENKNCLNTRHEILKTRSIEKVQIKNCKVVTGKWHDFYFNEVLTKSSNIDIDHVVPLKHAFEHGANKWIKKTREKFANDSLNLVTTNKKYNRQKGANGLTTWLPMNHSYACKYANRWFKVKTIYNLRVSKKETDYLRQLNCF